jgi:hypothetical protein
MPLRDTSEPEAIAQSSIAVKLYTPELRELLLSHLPTSEGLAEVHSRSEGNYMDFVKGDPDKVKAYEADRSEVARQLSIIRSLAKMLRPYDHTIPELLIKGGGHAKTVASSAPLGAPPNLRVEYGEKPGVLLCWVGSVAHAKGFQIWACEGDPSIEANWSLAGSGNSGRKIVITGRPAGRLTWLKARGMRRNQPGPWSACVSIMTN